MCTWSGTKRAWALTFVVVAAGIAAGQQAIPIAGLDRSTLVDFDREVLPILQKKCLACHSASEAMAELVLESPESILQGGESGPAVVAKRPDESRLLKLASHQDEPVMPPKGNDVNAQPMTPQELGLVKLWITQGATGGGPSSVLSPKEWQPLPKGVNPIYAVAVTPDGQFAACGRANQIHIYHVASGRLVTRLSDPELEKTSGRPGAAHLDIVQSLAFHPEGDLLASGGFRTVKLWRRPRDQQRLAFPAAAAPVSAAAVSPDGQTLALGYADNSLRLLRLADGEPLFELEGHAGPVTDLLFSPGGETLYSAAKDGTIRAWNAGDGSAAGRIHSPGEVNAIALIDPLPPQGDAPPGERLLASGGGDNLIRLWRPPSPPPAALEGALPGAMILAASGDGSLLAMAGGEGNVAIVSADRGERIASWQAHDGGILGLAFAPLPQPVAGADPPPPLLATAGADGAVRLWIAATGEIAGELRGTRAAVSSVAFHPGGKQIAAGAADGAVTVWNLEAAEPRAFDPAGGATSGALVLSPDGKRLAAAGLSADRPAIYIFDVESGKLTHTLLGHAAPVTALSFSGDGTRLASGGGDKTARIWNLADEKFPEIVRFDGQTAAVDAVAISGDGKLALCGSAAGEVKLFSAETGELVADCPGHAAAVVGVAFGAGGAPVSASADKTVRIWNPADGKQARAIALSTAAVKLAAAPDGAKLAVSLGDHSVALLQFSDGKILSALTGHAGPAGSLSFSRDGLRLVSADDREAIVWDAAAGRLLEILPVAGSACFGPSGDSLVVASAELPLTVEPLHFAAALMGFDQTVTDLAIHPGGQSLYAASLDGTVRGFNLANNQQQFSANHGAAVHDLALRGDGQLLASAGEDMLVKLWNAGNGGAGNPAQVGGLSAPATAVCFSDDGAKIVATSGAEGGETIVADLTSAGAVEESFAGPAGPLHGALFAGVAERLLFTAGSEGVSRRRLSARAKIAGHGQPVTSLAAIPGSPMQLLSGSLDGTVRRWNAANLQQIQAMNHGGPVTGVAVRGDGQRFASAGENNTARLWNGANGQQIAELKGDLRTKGEVARLAQEKTAAEAKVKTTTDLLAAGMQAVPPLKTAADNANTALAAADKKTADAMAALKTAAAAKTTAEQAAIEAASAAQSAAAAKEKAEQAAAAAQQELADAQRLLARAQQSLARQPENESLKSTVAKAETSVAMLDAEMKTAQAALPAPTKTAADAAQAANAAAQAAVATNKPYTDGLAAVALAENEQRLANQTAEVAARELKSAEEAVPAAEAAKTGAEERLTAVTAELAAAQEKAAAAEQPIRAVAFSPGGGRLATGGDYPAVHTWDAETGVAVGSFAGPAGPILAVAFTGDEGLFSASADKTAAVWGVSPDWRLERTIGAIDDPTTFAHRVVALDFSGDGRLLATGGGEPSRSGEVKVFSAADGSLVTAIENAHTDQVLGVSISRDGTQVASGAADKYVRSFSVETGELIRQFEGHTNHVLAVSWRADGQMLASCGADNTIQFWDPLTGDRVGNPAGGYNKQVTSIRFIGETQNTISCGGDAGVRMHNSGGQNIRNFGGAGDFLYSVDATPDTALIVAGGHDSRLLIWNGQNAQMLRTLSPPAETEAGESNGQ